MPRPKLAPGENTIDRVAITEHEDGTLAMEWRICLLDGRIVRRTTRGSSGKGELRRRAKAVAAELLASGGHAGAWKLSSPMSAYIKSEAIPTVQKTPDKVLRPNTRIRYVRVLSLLADELNGYSISDAIRPRILESALTHIAETNGTATARQASKVASKHVMQRLLRDEVITHNPLRDFKPQLPEHIAKVKPRGGSALTPSERAAVTDYLLAIDPEDTPAPKRGRYTAKDRVARRRTVIDVTLTQASTGLRISEVRFCRRMDVDAGADPMTITVTDEVSKTHRGRTVPVMDDRVAERIRARLDTIPNDPDALVFPSPASPGVWDLSNAEKAIKQLYREMADALDIPLLREVSTHVWRATLNTEWMNADIPDAVRSAYFGHSEDVNRQYYTGAVDVSELVAKLRRHS